MNVIGLMSGTSLDGVDVALLATDGQASAQLLHFSFYPYAPEVTEAVRACFGAQEKSAQTEKAERLVTEAHIEAITASGIHLPDVDLIGFHGQTITHAPAHNFTWQLGNAQNLADATGKKIIYDFRGNDVQAGGQGAPLLPVYHEVLAKKSAVELPVVIVNVGGVSNLTWVGPAENELIAFDTGPGNALLDDWVRQKTGNNFDQDGAFSAQGKVQDSVLSVWLAHQFFQKTGVKSLDRNAWSVADIQALNPHDGAATLAAFTAHAIAHGIHQTPSMPTCVIVCGGGRKNKTIMRQLETLVACPVLACDLLGWHGDAIEAEGFAYMAARTVQNLPISFPLTTGVPAPLVGGKIATPSRSS